MEFRSPGCYNSFRAQIPTNENPIGACRSVSSDTLFKKLATFWVRFARKRMRRSVSNGTRTEDRTSKIRMSRCQKNLFFCWAEKKNFCHIVSGTVSARWVEVSWQQYRLQQHSDTKLCLQFTVALRKIRIDRSIVRSIRIQRRNFRRGAWKKKSRVSFLSSNIE